MLNTLLVSLVVAPAVAGAALLLAGGAANRFAPIVSVVVAAATGVGAVAVSAATPRPAVATPFLAGSELGIAVDGLAAVVLPTVTIVAALVITSATGNAELRTARFSGFMLLFLSAVVLTVVATTLPTLLFAWEIMGAMSFAIAGIESVHAMAGMPYEADDPSKLLPRLMSFLLGGLRAPLPEFGATNPD